MSRLKVLSQRFGYLAGYQEWAEELAVMDKQLDERADLLERIKALEGELACSNNRREGLASRLHQSFLDRNQAQAALKLALDALNGHVNGFTLREYLKVQFPATVGHIPVELHLDRLDKAAAAIEVCGVD